MINFEQLRTFLKNEPSFRFGQIKQLIFRDLIDDWQQASVLPGVLRGELSKKFSLLIEAKDFLSQSSQTIKALICLADGLKTETVLMRHVGWNTVCVSSQVGCPLGCTFCATGQSGFKRNLDKWEIIEQILHFARYLASGNQKIDKVVFMGMGEPFLNYDNVLGAIRILNDKDGFNLGARHFSISTVGITEGIENLAKEPLQINLAISLHAPTDELRTKLVPADKKYPIAKILAAVDKYIAKTRRRVMFEYIMLKGVNDSPECARQLAGLMKKPLYFVNLISYNPTGTFQSSTPAAINKFKIILTKAGATVTQRYRFGSDIEAACGQLAGKNNK